MLDHSGVGRHAICEFWGASNLDSVDVAERALREAAAAGGVTLIEVFVHQFSPHGVSGIAVIAESHLALHTWPEHGYMAADFFTCGAHADVDAIIAAGGRVRLCKGAYDEPGSVAYRTRAAVDANYTRLMERLLLADAYPALATHDPKLIARAIEIVERNGIGRDRFEFQMLYGVRRDLQRTLLDRGYTVRIYVPYGQEWYPYFMRRLAERPANVGFMLRAVIKEETRRMRGK